MIHPIRLDEKDHTYWSGKRRAAGYSEICASMHVGVPDCPQCALKVRHEHHASFWTEDGREQGKNVHYWLRFLASGKTAMNAPDKEVAGYVKAIKKFLSESKFRYDGGETPLHNPRLDYACTPDLWGRINGIRYVIDAKKGARLKVHALQTAAQKLALAANGYYAYRRASLYLKKNGTYRLYHHNDRDDESRWVRIVTAFHDKKTYAP